MHIPDLIDRIDRASGNAKLAALVNASGSELLKTVLRYTYDPYRVYYVSQFNAPTFPDTKADPGPGWYDAAFKLLDDLADRKLTGNTAKNAVGAFYAGSGCYAELFERMLTKDLRCGIAASTVEKAFPNLLPSYGVMLAQKFKASRIKKWPVVIDRKNNGHRITAVYDPGKPVKLLTRTGREKKGYEHIRKQVIELGKHVGGYCEWDGELMVGMHGDRSAMEANAVFIIFDIAAHPDLFNHGDPGNQARIMRLHYHITEVKRFNDPIPHIQQSESYVAYNMDHVNNFYSHVISEGGEGIMIKEHDAPYVRDRSWSWMKYKPVLDADLKIVGRYEGTGKYAGMMGGAIVEHVVDDPDHPMFGQAVNVEVGSGWTDAERWDFWLGREKDNFIGRTLEVLYFQVTPYGSLEHPRVSRDEKTGRVRFRDDK